MRVIEVHVVRVTHWSSSCKLCETNYYKRFVCSAQSRVSKSGILIDTWTCTRKISGTHMLWFIDVRLNKINWTVFSHSKNPDPEFEMVQNNVSKWHIVCMREKTIDNNYSTCKGRISEMKKSAKDKWPIIKEIYTLELIKRNFSDTSTFR